VLQAALAPRQQRSCVAAPTVSHSSRACIPLQHVDDPEDARGG
jgi:hypothetical protein